MKKDNIKILLLLCFLFSIGPILINSCQKEPVVNQTNNVVDEYFVSSSLASEYSDKVICSNGFNNLQASSLNSTTHPKIIKKLKTILDNNKQAAFYIISYEDGGFVIISADKRVSPVLAYSENGSFPEEESDIPDGLDYWLSCAQENVEYVRLENVKVTNEIELQWKYFEKKGNNDLTLKSVTPPNPCTGTFVQKGPLLSTTWHQECGFNSLLPFKRNISGCIGITMPCDQAYAGCVAVAMGQVMKYHQKPTSYNWSLMPNAMPNAAPYPTEPARLIKAIDDALSATYTCTGTGATLSTAASVLKSTFGYSSATYSSYNFSTVKSNLQSNRPVILGGGSETGAHAWVCDGFQESVICMYDDNGNYYGSATYLYFDMKWGQKNTSSDGWYAFDNFNPSGNNYNSNKAMIYSIIP